MKKSKLAGIFIISALVIVSTLYSSKKCGNTDNEGVSNALALFQKEGYTDIKVIDKQYVCGIPCNWDGKTTLMGSLDSLIVSAKKDSEVITLSVSGVGLQNMVINKM